MHGEVLVLEHEPEVGVGRGVGAGRLGGREFHGHDGAALQQGGGAQRLAVGAHALVGDQTGGLGTGERELVGEKAVEALGERHHDAEGGAVGGHEGAVPASFAAPPPRARPSSHSDTASAIAPTEMAESATLKVGQR